MMPKEHTKAGTPHAQSIPRAKGPIATRQKASCGELLDGGECTSLIRSSSRKGTSAERPVSSSSLLLKPVACAGLFGVNDMRTGVPAMQCMHACVAGRRDGCAHHLASQDGTAIHHDVHQCRGAVADRADHLCMHLPSEPSADAMHASKVHCNMARRASTLLAANASQTRRCISLLKGPSQEMPWPPAAQHSMHAPPCADV